MVRRPNLKLGYIILPRLATFEENKEIYPRDNSDELSFKFSERSTTSLADKN